MNATKIAQVTLIALCLALTGAFAVLAASPAPAAAPSATAPSADVPQATPADDGAACAPVTPLVAPLFQEPVEQFGCPDPGCDDHFDCRNDIPYCPLGTFRTCIGSTGHCDGYCTCT